MLKKFSFIFLLALFLVGCNIDTESVQKVKLVKVESYPEKATTFIGVFEDNEGIEYQFPISFRLLSQLDKKIMYDLDYVKAKEILYVKNEVVRFRVSD